MPYHLSRHSWSTRTATLIGRRFSQVSKSGRWEGIDGVVTRMLTVEMGVRSAGGGGGGGALLSNGDAAFRLNDICCTAVCC